MSRANSLKTHISNVCSPPFQYCLPTHTHTYARHLGFLPLSPGQQLRPLWQLFPPPPPTPYWGSLTLPPSVRRAGQRSAWSPRFAHSSAPLRRVRNDITSCSPIARSAHTGPAPTACQARGGVDDSGPHSGSLRRILCDGCFHLVGRKPGNIIISGAFVVVVKPFAVASPFHLCKRLCRIA